MTELKPFPVLVVQLATEVCERYAGYGLTLGDLLSHRKAAPIPDARKELMLSLRARKWSYRRIGLALGFGRAAVVYYCQKKPRNAAPRSVMIEVHEIPIPDLSGEWAI